MKNNIKQYKTNKNKKKYTKWIIKPETKTKTNMNKKSKQTNKWNKLNKYNDNKNNNKNRKEIQYKIK